MPSYWSKKDERQYQHIRKSCMAERSKSPAVCKRIAASTVNKQRRKEGRTLTGPVERTMRERAVFDQKCRAYMREQDKVCVHPVGLGLTGLGVFAAGVAVASWLKKRETAVSGCSSC